MKVQNEQSTPSSGAAPTSSTTFAQALRNKSAPKHLGQANRPTKPPTQARATPEAAKPAATKTGTPTTPARPAPKSAPVKTDAPKVGRVVAQLRARAQAQVQVQRGVAESRTKASRQLLASRSADQVHAAAHAASAKVNATHQVERAQDQVRAGLFQAIERECAKAPTSSTEREPEQRLSTPAPDTSPRPEHQASAVAESSTASASSTQRAEAVAALVERIDAALKDGQPTLSLGLADRSGASSVEISKTAKGEVAVRIAARAGRRQNLEAAGEEIRSALEARGLRLKSLTVA
ncbi:MAG: hypothetical protein QM765_49050 [Myxococcales bacterium]